MADIKERLNEEIENQIMELAGFDAGSEERSQAVSDVATLYRLRIDEVKAETEFSEQAKDRYIRYALESIVGIGGLLFNIYVFKKGLKFEETGTFTSGTFRRMMNNFPKPFKK